MSKSHLDKRQEANNSNGIRKAKQEPRPSNNETSRDYTIPYWKQLQAKGHRPGYIPMKLKHTNRSREIMKSLLLNGTRPSVYPSSY